MKRLLARAIACSMLLVLPACGIPPLRPAQPGPGLPPTFKGVASPDNSAQLGIAQFFNDPVLAGLIDQALAGNRELAIMNEEVQIARNEVLARSGAYLPFVWLGGSAGLEEFSKYTPLGAAEHDLQYLPGRNFPEPSGNFLLDFNIFWQLDIWRELRNARDAARQRYRAASERRNYFVTKLVAEVAENYYGLMARDKRLENLEQIIKLQQESLEKAVTRFNAPRGNAPGGKTLGNLPVRRFEAEVKKNQSQILITRQEIIQVENRINFLLNRYPQPVERLTARFYDQMFPLSVGVPAQLLLNRPDIRQAERQLEAAGLDVKVARAHFFPVLAISGPVGPTGPAGPVGVQAFNPKYLFDPGSLIVNFAADMFVPLLNKRAIRAEYLSANAKQLQSVYNYQRVILNAVTEVYNRVSRVENYSQSIALKKEQVGKLEEAVKTAMILFLQTRIEYLDVLFAQRDLWDARFELIETRQEQLFAMVKVYQALGGGQVPFPDGPGRPGGPLLGGPGHPDGHPGAANMPEQGPPPRLLPPLPAP